MRELERKFLDRTFTPFATQTTDTADSASSDEELPSATKDDVEPPKSRSTCKKTAGKKKETAGKKKNASKAAGARKEKSALITALDYVPYMYFRKKKKKSGSIITTSTLTSSKF